MKAAAVFKKGELPKFDPNFPEPLAIDNATLVMTVKAAAVKNLDKMRASGQHYSMETFDKPIIVGNDGVGLLEDKSLVYAMGISGMIAEKALIDKNKIVPLPKGIKLTTAAALPNAVMGSGLALKFKAALQMGETVLINGATGVTGKVAVQLAKHYGAGKVIATGRNETSLQELLQLGADEVISVKKSDEDFMQVLKDSHKQRPIDIIIDYLWGHSAELILNAIKGDGQFTHKTRFVSIGGMLGDSITLSSSILRSTNIQLQGSGLGSWTKEEVDLLMSDIFPDAFKLAAEGSLKIETVSYPIEDIEMAWAEKIEGGKRLVIII